MVKIKQTYDGGVVAVKGIGVKLIVIDAIVHNMYVRSTLGIHDQHLKCISVTWLKKRQNSISPLVKYTTMSVYTHIFSSQYM